jgi:hypothetical protein
MDFLYSILYNSAATESFKKCEKAQVLAEIFTVISTIEKV